MAFNPKRLLVGRILTPAEVAQRAAQLAQQQGPLEAVTQMSRRSAITGGVATVAGLGAGMGGNQPAPLNAPGAQRTPIGIQPGAPGVVVAHYVIIFGANGGVFVYSGTPGPGNPPVAWMSSGTTDPYGNVLPNGAEMGLAGSGTFQAGDTIISPAGEFIYSGTPALGNLIVSLAPAAGTDSFGNAYPQGVNVTIGAISGTAITASTFSGTDFIINSTGEFLYSGTPAAGNLVVASTPGSTSATDPFGNTTPGPGVWNYYSIGGTKYCFGLSGGGIGAYSAATQAGPWTPYESISWNATTITVNGNGGLTMNNGPLVITPNSSILLEASATPAASSGNAVLYGGGSGYPKALGTTDTNVYNVGRAVHDTFVPQTISSVTAAQIDGLSHNVLNGQRYHYEAMVVYHGSQNAGAPIISLADPNTNTYTSVAAHEEWSVSGSAPSQTNTDLSFIDTTGPTLTTGRYCYKSEGFFQPSANQTFNLFAACTVAADTWVVDAAYLMLEPWT